MSTPDQPSSPAPDRGRLDDDDHDLLTFTEAGERLRTEVAAAQTRVAELEASAVGGDELVSARERLDALRRAAERNRAQPINDDNFEKFFGYAGKARRNVTHPCSHHES